MISHFKPTLQTKGAWMYPRLFWETGVLGQVLYLEAHAMGISATGIGCFFDDPGNDKMPPSSSLVSLYWLSKILSLNPKLNETWLKSRDTCQMTGIKLDLLVACVFQEDHQTSLDSLMVWLPCTHWNGLNRVLLFCFEIRCRWLYWLYFSYSIFTLLWQSYKKNKKNS